MKIDHHFGPQNPIQGVLVATYIKETVFSEGEDVPMHEHVHSHQSVLCSGSALLTVDGVPREIRGPRVINIEAGKSHKVRALTPITWLCIHATDETDPDKIDERLVG